MTLDLITYSYEQPLHANDNRKVKLEQELAMERAIYGEDQALAAAESTLAGFQTALAETKAARSRVSRN